MALGGGGEGEGRGGVISEQCLCCQVTVPSPEGLHDVQADGIEDNVGRAEVIEQHDKEAVVGQLVKLRPPCLLVLQQHGCHGDKDLVEEVDLDDVVGGVPREADQHHHQLHKGIHGVVALGSSQCGADGL